MKKYVNGVLTDMTAEEISARQSEENQAAIDKQAEIDKKTEAETKKTSGKQKLLDLGLTEEGLTEEEVKALIGA
jgi:hypothetical protein